MKLCKDCKHCVGRETRNWYGKVIGVDYTYAKCKDPEIASRVDGSAIHYCDVRRTTATSPCGPEGKLWEAKE